MTQYQLLQLNTESSFSHLAAIGNRGRMVALLGSGISVWQPSNLPAGQELTSALADTLIPSTVGSIQTVRELFVRSPFEHIMLRYPKTHILSKVLARTFFSAPPNAVHEAFARLVDRGFIDHIITTNYDVGLETMCRTICRGSRQPQIVVDQEEASQINEFRPVVFKIHGCARPDKTHSIISNFEDEGELDAWKRGLLVQILHNRSLMVCGYSGLDFEICAELAALRISSITWNAYVENQLTGNARRLLNSSVNSVVVIGDMRQMLADLGQPVSVERSSSGTSDLVGNLSSELDEWEFLKWRVWSLNGIGCSREGINIASQMMRASEKSLERQLESLFALAEARFHGGFYDRAALIYQDAEILAGSIDNLEKALKAKLGFVESARAGGHWIRAFRALRSLGLLPFKARDPLQRKKMEGDIALKSALLRQHWYRIAKKLHIPIIAAEIRERAKRDLQVAAEQSKGGYWFDFQHCYLLASRFDLKFSDIYDGPLVPLAPREGYTQLGYFIGEMLSVIDSERKGTTDATILRNLAVAYEIGCYSIVWKLSRLVAKTVSPNLLPAEFISRWREAWNRCEYTSAMRLYLRLFTK